MTLTTSAALCTVEVSKDVLQKDVVLALILKLVEQKTNQVTLKETKGGKNVLSMSLAGSTVPLQQRNAILRSLVGAALHGSQDDYHHCSGSSLMLSGGTFSVAASAHGSSRQASANAAAQQQWMSVASAVRSSSVTSGSFLPALNQVLETSAYVLPFASVPSLADLDLAVALLEEQKEESPKPAFPAAVTRWLAQISATLRQLAAETGVALGDLVLPADAPPAAPVFFYGTEDAEQVLGALYKDSAGSSSSSAQQAPKKQQQQEQQQQEQPEATTKPKGKMTKQEKKQQAKQEKQKDGGGGGKKGSGGGDQVAATYDVTALDIRVGKIVKVWPHETADKLYCEEIDLGNGEVRQIASGLRPFYQDAADLQDRVVLVLCNLKKRNLVGFPSHGMVLCASNADHTAVELVVPPEGSQLGDR